MPKAVQNIFSSKAMQFQQRDRAIRIRSSPAYGFWSGFGRSWVTCVSFSDGYRVEMFHRNPFICCEISVGASKLQKLWFSLSVVLNIIPSLTKVYQYLNPSPIYHRTGNVFSKSVRNILTEPILLHKETDWHRASFNITTGWYKCHPATKTCHPVTEFLAHSVTSFPSVQHSVIINK